MAGRFAAAAVRGLQGEGTEALRSPQHLAMVAKHFCAQGAALGGHNGKHTVIGERELREIHLPPMEQAIRAGVQGCMAAYNDIDGVYCHANRWLLTDLLRDELGFEGVAMSDGCAIDILRNIAGDYEGAARLAAEAGVDMNLWSVAYTRLEQAVKTGVVREETLDRAVERILALKFRLGLFENPYVDETLVLPALADPETEELNRQEARECAVLLKNNGILPLCPGIRRLGGHRPQRRPRLQPAGGLYSSAAAREGTHHLPGAAGRPARLSNRISAGLRRTGEGTRRFPGSGGGRSPGPRRSFSCWAAAVRGKATRPARKPAPPWRLTSER